METECADSSLSLYHFITLRGVYYWPLGATRPSVSYSKAVFPQPLSRRPAASSREFASPLRFGAQGVRPHQVPAVHEFRGHAAGTAESGQIALAADARVSILLGQEAAQLQDGWVGKSVVAGAHLFRR